MTFVNATIIDMVTVLPVWYSVNFHRGSATMNTRGVSLRRMSCGG